MTLLPDHGHLSDAEREATTELVEDVAVAERLAARPGGKDYGVLSIAARLAADVTLLMALPPGAFRPAPAVSSAVVRLTFRPPSVAIDDRVLFDGMVKSLFMQRRKTLGNAFKPFAFTRGADPAEVLRATGLDATRRPETLDLPELAQLCAALAAAPRSTVV